MSMILRNALLFVLALVLGACGGGPQWNAELPYPPEASPGVGDILHLPTGYYVDEDRMLANVSGQSLVYVGEMHDNPASHRLELTVLTAMHRRHPGKVALGMEMFTRSQQNILDRWVAGELSEKEFLKESRWFTEGWSFAFDYYRDILEYCRDNAIPVVALNVDKELARQVSMTELSEMTAEQRALLPEMDFDDPYQRAMVEAMVAGHDAGTPMLESFHRRQTLWDETMAQSVADYLQDRPDMHMMVMAGSWHVEYGFGIPRRVFRRLPLPYAIIGSQVVKVAEGREPRLMDVTLPGFPMPEADYLVSLEYEPPVAKGMRLGVLLDDADDEPGVRLAGVMPGSVAHTAGLRKGERIIGFDGEVVLENFDIIYAVKNKREGDTANLVVAGDDGERTVEVTFVANKDSHHGK